MSGEDKHEIQSFLRLIVSTTRKQRLALFKNITSKQCHFIRQVAYNILINTSLQISEKDRLYLRRSIGLLKKLASRRIDLEEKKKIVLDRHLLVKRIASIALQYLQ